jgi:hypothetical protein
MRKDSCRQLFRTMRRVLCLSVLLAVATTLQAAVIVVNTENPAASDETGDGSEARPFKSIQKGAKAAKAGDTVYVMAGDYAERITLAASGAEGKPLVFHALPHGEVTMRGFDLTGQSFVRIQGFKVISDKPSDRTPGIAVGGGGTGIEILDNRFENMYMGLSGGGSNVRVAYNKFYKTQFCMVCGSTSEKWLIESNDFERQFQHRGGDCDYARMWGKHHMVRTNHYHGTKRSEIGKAHLDCIQSFNVKKNSQSMFLHHLTFERNVCTSFSQAFMLSTSTPGTHHTMTFRHNVFHAGDAWGLYLDKLPDMAVEQNTFAIIKWYGFGKAGNQRGRVVNNLFFRICIPYTSGPGIVGKGNMTSECENPPKGASKDEYVVADPKFADPEKGNFRLTAGSPAIDAGVDGKDIGGLEYPNVYYVDPRHPGASDDHFGYAGRPFRTIGKALAVAVKGETILLHGGTYRESITAAPSASGVTIRPVKDQTPVIVSGADRIVGWKREGNTWSAPLAARPATVVRDGAAWTDCTYNADAKRLTLTGGGDPRLHTFEAVVREHAIDLSKVSGLTIENVRTARTSGDPVAAGKGNNLTNVKPITIPARKSHGSTK